jgi:hypothetical protein
MQEKISNLKQIRKNKKNAFLSLLESVIDKIK